MRRDPARPLSDPEVLELLRDEPELLAIADAIQATQRRPRLVGRLPRPGLPVLAVAVAATLFLVMLVPFRGEEPGLLEQALAAVGTKPVVYLVASTDSREDSLVDLRTGRTTPTTVELEIWHDRRTGSQKAITRRNGTVVAEVVESARTAALPAAVRLFVSGYRAALAEGTARPAGEGTIDGRPVVFVEVPEPGGGLVEVALDGEDYVPIRFRLRGDADVGAIGPSWRVGALETRQPGEVDFSGGTPAAGAPSAGAITSSRAVSRAELAQLAPFAVWPGRRIADFVLETLSLQGLRRNYPDGRSDTATGVELRYGGPNNQELRINVAASPEPAYRYAEGRLTFNFNPIPPANVIDLVEQSSASGTSWFGQMRRGDAYVTIEGDSRESVLAAARALRPVASDLSD